MPVEPEVNRIAAISSGAVSARVKSSPALCAMSPSSVWPPQNQRRPTVRLIRQLLRAQPSTTRAACASGMPMKAVGAASSRHCLSARRLMPGSISTGTTPALNMANISRNSSGEGRTISAARVPRTMPARAIAAAMALLRSSSVRQESSMP